MPSRHLPPPFPSPQPTPSFTQSQYPLPTVAVAGIGTILLTFLFCCRNLPRGRTTPSDSKPPNRFSYSTLRRATSDFSPSRRLGQGGFGSVFLGNLPSNPQPVAVKLMDSGSLQGEREFHNELFLASKIDSKFVVPLLGFASKRHNMLLVYEYMSNGSLQDALLHRKCVELRDWNLRFSIAVDIAKGIEYLHRCEPPIVHCDIKPSNILLDENFNAKIGDFGLARVKEASTVVLVEEEIVGEKLKPGVEGKRKEELESYCAEDYGSVMEDTESLATMTTIGLEEFSVRLNQSPENFVTVNGKDMSPDTNASITAPVEIDSDRNIEVLDNAVKDYGKGKRSASGKEWWWKQENEVQPQNGAVKDYVMEWIGTEIKKERPKNDWIGASSSSRKIGKSEKNKSKKRLEWWASLDDKKNTKKEKRRPAREWWKEEYCDELTKKNKKKKRQKGTTFEDIEENWWPNDEGSFTDKKKKSKTRNKNSRGSIDWWMDGLSSGELWKGRFNSHDSFSGEIIPKSGAMSSTPSMRGTVCYIAPEYGCGNGGGLSEKCDVYSFGVLLLVIIAGRRPLQVTDSPMSEFQRANLVSWSRRLARAGKLIDLVDKSVEYLNQEQALLCIRVALLCLQKSPARRPSSAEVLAMLLGKSEPPKLPYEHSSSSQHSRVKKAG